MGVGEILAFVVIGLGFGGFILLGILGIFVLWLIVKIFKWIFGNE